MLWGCSGVISGGGVCVWGGREGRGGRAWRGEGGSSRVSGSGVGGSGAADLFIGSRSPPSADTEIAGGSASQSSSGVLCKNE